MLLNKNKSLIVILVALAIMLSACGGGSSSDTSSTNSSDQESGQDQTEQDTPPVDEQTPPEQTQNNQQPNASISATQQVTSGETVTLDGSGSSDPDGDALNFIWSQTQGASINLGDLANPTLSFIAPNVQQTTSYSFQLQVDDGQLSDTAVITISVSPMLDTTPPGILSRTPQAEATDVSITTDIRVDFNEAINATLISSQSLQLSQDSNPVPGSVDYDALNNRITFSPDAALATETTYTVTLGGNIQDLAGNPVTAVSWQFTTGAQYNLGQTSQGTIDLCMSTSDKVMLTLVNDARAVARNCGSTNYAAVPALAWHCSLEQAAQGHSTSMADNDYFSHTGIDGSDPGDRITAAGYNWRTYGENIAAGYNDEQSAMTAWLESPGHCANIMNGNFSEIGVAAAENPTSTYLIYWTQEFADSF